VSPKKIEFLVNVLIVFFLGWALWEARDWPAQSKLFPWSLGFIVLALALSQVVIAWRATLRESRVAGATEKKAGEEASASEGTRESSLVAPDIARKRGMVIGFWIVAFFIGISFLGFKLGSLLLTFAFLRFTAKENWIISAVMAVVSYLFFWLVFDIGLRVPLGSGLIGDYFGLS
jgi:hypothetical protein